MTPSSAICDGLNRPRADRKIPGDTFVGFSLAPADSDFADVIGTKYRIARPFAAGLSALRIPIGHVAGSIASEQMPAANTAWVVAFVTDHQWHGKSEQDFPSHAMNKEPPQTVPNFPVATVVGTAGPNQAPAFCLRLRVQPLNQVATSIPAASESAHASDNIIRRGMRK